LTSVARPLSAKKYKAPRGGAIEPAHTLGPIPINDARENIEATRIAGELRKLAEAGALKEPGDLSFFASVIRTFEATFLPEGPRNTPRQIIPTRILSPAGVPEF
jgi:hypothetical protein